MYVLIIVVKKLPTKGDSCTFLLFLFLGPHLRHMEVPRLGVESELQLPAYITATAMWDLSHVCNLHYSSWPCQILNPLSDAKDGTHILIHISQVHYHYRRDATGTQ